MVDAGWVKEDCDSWHEARWPLPSPVLVRAAKGAIKDLGPVLCEDVTAKRRQARLSISPVWYWYALPPPRKRTETMGQPLIARDRVQFDFGRRQVSIVGWDIERKRSVGIISFR